MSGLTKFELLSGGYGLNIASGQVTGAKGLRSLAERDAVEVVSSGTDVWLGSATQIPVPPAVGEQMELVSTSINDTSGGTGTRTVDIHYLDAAGIERVENVTLDGTTAVTTAATNMRFVQFIHSKTVGATGVAEGNISISRAGAPAVVYSVIEAGGNFSLTSSRMVPAGKTYYLAAWNATSTVQNQQVTMRIRSTSEDGIYIPGVFLFIDSCVLETSTYRKVFSVPIVVPAFSIIKVSAWANQAGTDVSASFDGYLLDN